MRIDGVKLGISEVLGLELDESKLGAFAGALNALDFPAQLLVRQHPPRLEGLRASLSESQPGALPRQVKEAAESLHRLLTGLETRDGILDRRFYAICEYDRAGDLRGSAGAGRSFGPSHEGPGPSHVPRVGPPRRFSRRVRRRRSRIGRGQPQGHASRRQAGALPPPRQMAEVVYHRGSCRASWPRARRWTSRYTSAPYRRSRRPAPWSGRRSGSSRRRACRSGGGARCPRRRRSPWRT